MRQTTHVINTRLSAGGKLVIVNLQKTPKDKKSALLIRGRADEVMKTVMDRLQIPIPVYMAGHLPYTPFTDVRWQRGHFCGGQSEQRTWARVHNALGPVCGRFLSGESASGRASLLWHRFAARPLPSSRLCCTLIESSDTVYLSVSESEECWSSL